MQSTSAFLLLCGATLLVQTVAFMPSAPLGLRTRAALVSPSISRSQTAGVSAISMQKRDENKLFVGGLPWALDSADLKETFASYGEIMEANVVLDRETGRSRGFGFVTFVNKEDAQKACDGMNQAEIGGRTVNVNFAQAREGGGSGGGSFRGRGGGGYRGARE